MITDVQAISILAATFIIIYFMGTVRNRKLMQKYARILKDQMTPLCDRVGFRAYRTSSFRALCQLKSGGGFSKIEIAVSLVDRENALHYPLSIVTRDYDRFVCWGFLENTPPTNIEVLQKSERKLRDKVALQKSLTKLTAGGDELNNRFVVLVENGNLAKEFLADSKVRADLIKSREFLKHLSLNREESWIYLLGILKEESLKPLLDLILSCGKALSSKSL